MTQTGNILNVAFNKKENCTLCHSAPCQNEDFGILMFFYGMEESEENQALWKIYIPPDFRSNIQFVVKKI